MAVKKKSKKKKGRVKINKERCKGCGLCVVNCPEKVLRISETSNKVGYFPAEVVKKEECTGCACCAIICPDACIEVKKYNG